MKNNTKAIIYSRKSADSEINPEKAFLQSIMGLFTTYQSNQMSECIRAGIARKRLLKDKNHGKQFQSAKTI